MDLSRIVPAGNSPGDGPAPMGDLASELQAESDALKLELDEIELLLQQAGTEAERHESRRVQAETRMAALDADSRSSVTDQREARDQLLTQARRATLMQAQLEVLEGKLRALQRYQRHVEALVPRVTELTGGPTDARPGQAGGSASRAILAAQEEMRREISRRMHDGPAQSIANIALQAQVVQRLFSRDPGRAEAELGQLSAMVEHALEATKSFIFEVRPMVLDDLGLVPTLRRACLELTRREQIPVLFESTGTDRRLDPELESSVYRIVDDALGGYLGSRPASILVNLDWTADAVRAIIQSQTQGQDAASSTPARRPKSMNQISGPIPPALAAMIREREDSQPMVEGGPMRGRALPNQFWSDIRARAAAVGISVELRDEGRLLEARLSTTSQD